LSKALSLHLYQQERSGNLHVLTVALPGTASVERTALTLVPANQTAPMAHFRDPRSFSRGSSRRHACRGGMWSTRLRLATPKLGRLSTSAILPRLTTRNCLRPHWRRSTSDCPSIGSSSGSAVAGMQRGRNRPGGPQSRKGVNLAGRLPRAATEIWKLPSRGVSAVPPVGLESITCRLQSVPDKDANGTLRSRGQ